MRNDDNVESRIFANFINDLREYCGSQRSMFLTMYYSLSAAKVKFAKEIILALDSAAKDDDITQLQKLANNIARSNSILTAPTYNILRNLSFATPNSEFASQSPRDNSEELEVCTPTTFTEESEYYEFFRSYYEKLHQLRNGKEVGRLDALIYAMCRTTYLMHWLQQREIDFEMLDIIVNQSLSGSFIELSINPSDKIYQRAVRSLTYYIACLTFDRALARFATLKAIPEQYYLGSGVYKAIFHDKKEMKKIDQIRDKLIKCLILLQSAYHKKEYTNEERDFALYFLLREPDYIITTIYGFAGGTKFAQQFREIDLELDKLQILKQDSLKLDDVETEEFKDHEEDMVFISEKDIDSYATPLSHTVYPSPLLPLSKHKATMVS